MCVSCCVFLSPFSGRESTSAVGGGGGDGGRAASAAGIDAGVEHKTHVLSVFRLLQLNT